jgi:hypothetical protein
MTPRKMFVFKKKGSMPCSMPLSPISRKNMDMHMGNLSRISPSNQFNGVTTIQDFNKTSYLPNGSDALASALLGKTGIDFRNPRLPPPPLGKTTGHGILKLNC